MASDPPYLPASAELGVIILGEAGDVFQVFNKNCAPTYTLLLKTFVITVILMKPHQLCPCLPLIAFLCTLF